MESSPIRVVRVCLDCQSHEYGPSTHIPFSIIQGHQVTPHAGKKTRQKDRASNMSPLRPVLQRACPMPRSHAVDVDKNGLATKSTFGLYLHEKEWQNPRRLSDVWIGVKSVSQGHWERIPCVIYHACILFFEYMSIYYRSKKSCPACIVYALYCRVR